MSISSVALRRTTKHAGSFLAKIIGSIAKVFDQLYFLRTELERRYRSRRARSRSKTVIIIQKIRDRTVESFSESEKHFIVRLSFSSLILADSAFGDANHRAELLHGKALTVAKQTNIQQEITTT